MLVQNQKLINHDNLRFLNRSRATRIYLDNKPNLLDPVMDDIYIIAIPHKDNHNFQLGDTLTAYSEYSGTIFQNKTFTIFANIDMELLFECRNINTQKYAYFAVIENYSIH